MSSVNMSEQNGGAYNQLEHRGGSVVTSDDDEELLYAGGTVGTAGGDADGGADGTKSSVRRRRIFVQRVLCGVLLLLASVACVGTVVALAVSYAGDGDGDSSATDDGNSGPTARVTCGTVVGTEEGGVAVFKGVPYAVAPVGRRGRWLPPQALDEETCWEEPYLANQYGTPCCQEGFDGEECEDCLYLNIWSPVLEKGARLPVMVHIHGGGLVVGSGNSPGSMPTSELALASSMVYVSFSYRLGVLGFLALEELSELGRERGEEPRHAAGNYGFMDQVLALKWVKENIVNFGGNPDQVTIFGEDSGATSILALLAVQETKGLFHRAWLTGPSPHYEASLKTAQEQNKRTFLKRAQALSCGDVTGRDMLECLLGMSPMDLMNATNITAWHNKHFWSLPTLGETSTVIAIVDQSLLKKAPHVVWGEGNINPVPILLGNNAEEVSDSPQPAHVDKWNSTAYERYVTSRLSPWSALGDEPLKLYPASSSHPPAQQLASMITDMRGICGTDEKFKVAATYSSEPVYRYVVTDLADDDQPGPRKFAFRGFDSQAFFDSLDKVNIEKTAKVSRFQKEIRETVWEFARTGRLRNWGPFPGHTALFNAETNSTEAYHMKQCKFWRLHGMFPPYAWIN